MKLPMGAAPNVMAVTLIEVRPRRLWLYTCTVLVSSSSAGCGLRDSVILIWVGTRAAVAVQGFDLVHLGSRQAEPEDLNIRADPRPGGRLREHHIAQLLSLIHISEPTR